MKGKSAALCEMYFSTIADRVETNEVVITSGLDGVYPRGLTIGRIRLMPGSSGVQQTVELVPAAQLDKLEMVAVLQVPREQIRAKLEELKQLETQKAQIEKAPSRKKGGATP